MTIAIFGCNHTTVKKPIEPLQPAFDAELRINKLNLVVNSGTTSDIVTLTIRQLKDLDNSTFYKVKLQSPNKELVYFVQNNDKVSNITTRPFAHKDETQLYDFKISAKKCDGQELARYTLTLVLFDKDNKQIGPETNMKVDVT